MDARLSASNSHCQEGISPRRGSITRWPYDAQSDQVILFGGSPGFASDEDPYGDTWAYDANADTWTAMDLSLAPPARENAVMWYDPAADLVFLFGCSKGDGLPWEVFGGEQRWTTTTRSTPGRCSGWTRIPATGPGVAAEFDEETGVAMLFGGAWYDADRRSQGEAEDMWTYRHEGR